MNFGMPSGELAPSWFPAYCPNINFLVYDGAVRREPHSLAYVPDCFKTQEMSNEAAQQAMHNIFCP